MSNIQYFSNGIRRYQVGGRTSYQGIPNASNALDAQFLSDMKRWQNGEIEWTDDMSRYYTNVSTDARYNQTGKQWQQVNSDVKAWETPGARDSEGRISLPAVTVTARRNSNQRNEPLRDIYRIPENYTESERNFIRRVQERPNYKGIMYGMDAAAVAPFLLAASGLGAGSGVTSQATRTLGSSQTNIPASIQYFSSQPISSGTRMALTANGTAVAVPSISVNTPGLMTTLGANTLLGKLLYDRTMNAKNVADRRQAQADAMAQATEEEATPVNSQPEPEQPNNSQEPKNPKEPNKLSKWLGKQMTNHPIRTIGFITAPIFGINAIRSIKRNNQEANERLGDPSSAAEQTLQQLNGNPVTQDTVAPLSIDQIMHDYDSLLQYQSQFKTDTL